MSETECSHTAHRIRGTDVFGWVDGRGWDWCETETLLYEQRTRDQREMEAADAYMEKFRP